MGMQKVPHHERLYKRGNTYQYRFLVPAELRAYFGGKSEIKKSLKTDSLKEAKVRWARECELTDKDIAEARAKLGDKPNATRLPTSSEAWAMVREWHSERLEREKVALASAPREALPSRLEAELEVQSTHGLLGKVGRFHPMADDVIRFLCERKGLSAPAQGNSLYNEMADLIHRARADVSLRLIALMKLDFNDHPEGADRIFLDGPPTGSDSHRASATLHPGSTDCLVTLAAAIEAHHQDPGRRANQATRDQGRGKLDLFQLYIGKDRDVRSVSRADVSSFRELLLQLPAKALERFPQTELRSIPTANEKLAVPFPSMSHKTAKMYLDALKALFRWLVASDQMDKSPADGLNIHVDDEEEGEPFTIDQLNRVFSAPLFTGCANDERGYAKAGDLVIRRGRYWIPLVALFTGMRLGEICQLWSDDILQENGVWCIRVRANKERHQRVKNSHSPRVIPVHDELCRLGFLLWAKGKQAPSPAPLFPECLPKNPKAARSRKFSAYFTRFLASVGLGDEPVVFHSFRHTFRTAIHESGLDYAFAREYGGWRKTEVHERYLGGTSKSVLKERLDRVKIQRNGVELDLSHLPLTDRLK